MHKTSLRFLLARDFDWLNCLHEVCNESYVYSFPKDEFNGDTKRRCENGCWSFPSRQRRKLAKERALEDNR